MWRRIPFPLSRLIYESGAVTNTYSLTIKLLKDSNRRLWWEDNHPPPKLIFTTPNSCTLQSSSFASQLTHVAGRSWKTSEDKARLSHSTVPCGTWSASCSRSHSVRGSAHDRVPTPFLALCQTNSNFALKSRQVGMFTDEKCSRG